MRGKGGHLFRLTFSVVLQGGRNTANKYQWLCGECSQCLSHTGFAPTHSVRAFLVYTAPAPGCSAGELSQAGPGLRALPRSKLLRFWFLGTPQMHRLGWACVLCPSQVQAFRRPGAWRAHSPQVGCASYHLPGPGCSGSAISGVPCVSSGELISGCDPPGRCQPSRIPGRLG